MKAYSRVEDVSAYVVDLATLHEWLAARREVARSRPGTRAMQPEFVIQGQWIADQFGQFTRITVRPEYEAYKPERLPLILTRDQFEMLLSRKYGEAVSWGWGFGAPDSSLPPADVVCTECLHPWELANISDVFSTGRTEAMSLAAWVGRPLQECVAELCDTRAEVRVVRTDSAFLRNDRYIDRTPTQHGLEKNPRGWVGADVIDYKTYRVQDGDDLSVTRQQFYHKACHDMHVSHVVRTEFTAALERSTRATYGMVKIPNQYGSFDFNGPWFLVDTDLGLFRMGWRRHVIEVSRMPQPNESSAISLEVRDMLHVDNYEALTAYLSNLTE